MNLIFHKNTHSDTSVVTLFPNRYEKASNAIQSINISCVFGWSPLRLATVTEID